MQKVDLERRYGECRYERRASGGAVRSKSLPFRRAGDRCLARSPRAAGRLGCGALRTATRGQRKQRGAGYDPRPFKVQLNLGGSHGIVHLEFDGMGGVLESINLPHLEFDVAVDEVVVEHAAFLEEGTVAVHRFECLTQTAAYRGNLAQLFRWQRIQILVHRLARMDLVLDSVESRH